ncbi:MAG: sulfurtransferase TusA family protein [Actinomycetota bacterium]
MIEINCIGARCPIPIIETAKVASTLGIGESILLKADDPATQNDLFAWARMTGHVVEVIDPITFTIRK